jgi:hypothetical protein
LHNQGAEVIRKDLLGEPLFQQVLVVLEELKQLETMALLYMLQEKDNKKGFINWYGQIQKNTNTLKNRER